MKGINIRAAIPEDVPMMAALLEQLARRYITVEFTPTAEAKFLESNGATAYESFGFVRAGQPQSSDGVLFNPMVVEDAG